jgi:hypothetical protein
MTYKGNKEAYPGIGKIEYEGKIKIPWHSDNPMKYSGDEGSSAFCDCLLAFVLWRR